jgi:NAD(P)-dependent dehydrogenase (short-subunit alcohol dehydrogenase family)
MDLTGKVALVTGAGSGIGRAVALRLAAAGAKIVVADYNEEAGARTCAELKKSGAEATSRRTDVSKTEEVEELIAFTVQTFGRLDCAVNKRRNSGRVGFYGRLHRGKLGSHRRYQPQGRLSVHEVWTA